MPARYTPPRPYQACQGTVWRWLGAVQAAVDDRAVPGLTGTTTVVARGLLAYADRDDGTARPGLQHLGHRTHLARRTLLLHLGLLVEAGLLVRVTRGRHSTLTEQLHTGRTRNAAVYRLALPTAHPAPANQAFPTSGPVGSCTPSLLRNQEEEPPVTREENAGLAASGDRAWTNPDGIRRAPTRSTRPPPRPNTKRHRRWQAADELRAALPLLLLRCSTPAVASAMRQGLAEGWTADDFELILARRPLPALPDRLGGRAAIRQPAGLLAWRVTHWFHDHGPTRPTVQIGTSPARQRAAAAAADAAVTRALRGASRDRATPHAAANAAAAIRHQLGWT